MQQLGNGYVFIDNEYKIKIGNNNNYMDKHLKTNEENKTMGIIIYKESNKYLLHYSTDKNIYAAKYITIML